MVKLWRLAALNPRLVDYERDQLASLLQLYQRVAVHRISRLVANLGNGVDHVSVTSVFFFRRERFCTPELRPSIQSIVSLSIYSPVNRLNLQVFIASIVCIDRN